MMAKKYSAPKPISHKASFEELVVRVPAGIFVTMVSKSGLPHAEAQELCAAFKKLRNDNS